MGRVTGVAGEDLDATPGAADVFGAGRLAVAVVFRKRTHPAGRALGDGRVFGFGTGFGRGVVCGHGLLLQRKTGSGALTPGRFNTPRGTRLSLPVATGATHLVVSGSYGSNRN